MTIRAKVTAAAVMAGVAASIGLAADDPAAASADWPCWRGARGDGLPAVKGIRTDWTGGLQKVWEVTDLCRGNNSEAWSAPVMVGDKLIVAGRDGGDDTVFCLNALTGATIWTNQYAAGGPQVQYGNGPRATPAIDGDRVYTYGCLGHLACWSLSDGKRIWLQDLGKLDGQRPFWGHASSPLVWKDTVVVQGGGKILVAAFRKSDGALAWKSGEGTAGYAAPMLATVGGATQLVVFAASGLIALNPDDGTKLWTYAHQTAYDMNCATPVQVGDRLLIASANEGGQRGGAELLTLTTNGPARVWANRALGDAHNDPVVAGGCLYAFSGFSMNDRELQCLDFATAQQKWTTADAGGPGNVVLVDGYLLCLGNKGKLTLAKPSAQKFEKIAEFQAVTGHPVWTVPVIAGDRLYVRFCGRLICYRIK
jgi:outer membrane protein assembly factor BamB